MTDVMSEFDELFKSMVFNGIRKMKGSNLSQEQDSSKRGLGDEEENDKKKKESVKSEKLDGEKKKEVGGGGGGKEEGKEAEKEEGGDYVEEVQFSDKQAKIYTIIFALAFASIYVSTDTALHYMTTIFPENAAYFLAVYAFVLAVIGLFVPHLQRCIGIKLSLHISSFLALVFIGLVLGCLFLWDASEDESFPSGGFAMVVIGSFCLGVSQSMYLFAQTCFMDIVSTKETRSISGLYYSIFYLNTPIGNGLAGLFNTLKFRNTTIVAIFLGFCVVGVALFFAVCKNGKPRDRYRDIGPYFREMWVIATSKTSLSLIVCAVMYQLLNGFVVSIFTKQLPSDKQGEFVGWAFCGAGVALILGSWIGGKIVDKSKRACFFVEVIMIMLFFVFAYITLVMDFESAARVVFFFVALFFYGLAFALMDVNFIWLILDPSFNGTIFYQFLRAVSYFTMGLVYIISKWTWEYPHYYIIVGNVVLVSMVLVCWHYVFTEARVEDGAK